jgi:hypothetical protein
MGGLRFFQWKFWGKKYICFSRMKTARGLGLGGVPAFLTWHIYTVRAYADEGTCWRHFIAALIVIESHAFCEHGPLSTWTFVNMDLCQHGPLSTCAFVNMDFCQHGPLPTWTFVNMDLCQHDLCQRWPLSTLTFVNMDLCQHWPLSTWTFLNKNLLLIALSQIDFLGSHFYKVMCIVLCQC